MPVILKRNPPKNWKQVCQQYNVENSFQKKKKNTFRSIKLDSKCECEPEVDPAY